MNTYERALELRADAELYGTHKAIILTRLRHGYTKEEIAEQVYGLSPDSPQWNEAIHDIEAIGRIPHGTE